MGLAIGVDVGGTKVLAGVVDESGRILEQIRRPTPSSSPERTADAIAAVVDELVGRYAVTAVGVGAAGFVDASRSVVLFAPNLAWRDEPLREELQNRIGLPVAVENDANAMAWAEYRFGAGRGHHDVVCVTVGTGIGGGLVIGDRLHRGRFGIGGEVGHMRVVPGGYRCGCGNRGCWEQYASGRALVREAREFAAVDPVAGARLLADAGGEVDGITGPVVTRAAQDGDPLAVECFRIIGEWLGQGLADLAAILDPGCFVVGGGVSEAGELLVDPTRAAYAAALTGRGYRPTAEIRCAALGAEAGLVGAGDLARQSG